MKNKKLIILSFVLCFASLAKAQDLQPTEVSVTSWKKGTEKITEQTLRIKLTPQNPDYEKNILSYSGKTYRLLVIPDYSKSLKGRNWKVELREVYFDENGNKQILGDDLLFVERPGEVGDNFPRENFIAYFYPNEQNRILINGMPWVEGKKPLYPLKVVRNIHVENFLVTLRTGDVKFNEKENNNIDSFEIFVEFNNPDKITNLNRFLSADEKSLYCKQNQFDRNSAQLKTNF